MDNKWLARAAGMVFWTYAWSVISYFFAMSYLSDVFISVFNNNGSLYDLMALAPYITDLQHTAVLAAGLIFTISIGLIKLPASHRFPNIRFIPLILFLVPGISYFGYIKCRFEIGGACTSSLSIGVFVGSLLFLASIIGLLLTRVKLPRKTYLIALIPLFFVTAGTIFYMYFASSWGSAALEIEATTAKDLFTLGNYQPLPGDWHVWIQTGITLQIIFAIISMIGFGLCIYALTKPQVEIKPSPVKRKKR